jgi:hypothetical protein
MSRRSIEEYISDMVFSDSERRSISDAIHKAYADENGEWALNMPHTLL